MADRSESIVKNPIYRAGVWGRRQSFITVVSIFKKVSLPFNFIANLPTFIYYDT